LTGPSRVVVVEPRAPQQLRYVVAAQQAKVALELRFVADTGEFASTFFGSEPAPASDPSHLGPGDALTAAAVAAIIAQDGQLDQLCQQFPHLATPPTSLVATGTLPGQTLPFARLLALMAETEQLCQQADER
jgi:hypothetical protein